MIRSAAFPVPNRAWAVVSAVICLLTMQWVVASCTPEPAAPYAARAVVEIVPSGGSHPRNFNLTPDGAWLVCANRDSDNLVSFKVDSATGRLTATGHTTTVPKAVCVQFAVGGN